MSQQQKQIIAYLISTVLVVAYYAWYVFQKHQMGEVDVSTISSLWGKAILIAMGANIILTIVMTILVSIAHAMITKETELPEADERDHLIDLKASRISYIAFGIGFAGAMVMLAIGQAPLLVFHTIVFSIFAAAIFGNLVQLYFYRRGF